MIVPKTVADWVRAHAAGGDATLAAKSRPGRTPFLTAAQEKQVFGWPADRATARGFWTDLWAARRVAELIRRRFGVAFHPHHPQEWLTERNYSPQKPTRRARQRNDEAIDRWVETDWPRIKKARRRRSTSS